MTATSRRESGFTLVELVVVVMIIAILIAAGIPTLLGAIRRGQDRSAQSMARQALVTAKTIFQHDEDYQAATISALKASEPGLRFLEANESSALPQEASVDSPDTDTFIAAVYSTSGRCFYIRDEATRQAGGTTYASKASNGTDCTAQSAPNDEEFRGRWQ